MCILAFLVGTSLLGLALSLAIGDGFCIERHNGPQCYKGYGKLALSAIPLKISISMFIGCAEKVTGRKIMIMNHALSFFVFIMVIPLFVGREKSIRCLDAAMANDKQIFLVAQKDAGVDEPAQDDIYNVGTIATILQLLKLFGRAGGT